ncbi:hypothetical protein MLD38_016409 [Melastoma candidum]|uniref:Uncharacterized protein n=1 Tax=Melastoma candidum TaxID=119954 RepID=A0ACB9RJG6_9MYRT|nr:hypothetical protein MLD38_016409 [Melastoma candidum]
MPMVLAECCFFLKAGGMLLFRDCGLYDMTVLRFKPDQRVGFREYIQADGTRSYFCLPAVCPRSLPASWLHGGGKKRACVRVWVHGKFWKAK